MFSLLFHVVTIPTIAVCLTPEIVFLHDKTYTEFDLMHDWLGKLELFIRDVSIRFPMLKFSSATSVRTLNPSSLGDKRRNIVGLVSIARCQKARTLVNVAGNIYPDVPLLRLDTEYCGVSNAMLTWVKTDWPCFAYVFQNWASKLLVRSEKYSANNSTALATKRKDSLNAIPPCSFREVASTHLVDTYKSQYRRNILNGQTIRLGAIQMGSLSVLSLDNDGQVLKYGGVMFDHMEVLAYTLNYSFTIKASPDAVAGYKLTNGSWSGLFGIAAKQELQLISTAQFLQHRILEVVDYLYSGTDIPSIFVTPLPKVKNSWLASAYPFSSEVWLAVISTLVVLSLISYYQDLIYDKLIPSTMKRPVWHSYFFSSLALIRNQRRSDAINRHSARLTFVAWCIFGVVFINLYMSVLVGYLTLPEVAPVIRNFDDLAQSNEIRMAFLDNGPLTSLFFDPKATGNFAIIRDKARNHPEDFVSNRLDLLEKVATNERYIAAESLPFLYLALAQDYAIQGRCRFGLVHDIFYTGATSYVTPKGSPYWHFFYVGWERIAESGILEKTNEKLKVSSPCISTGMVVPVSKKLALSDLISPLAFYGIGCLVGTVALVIEIMLRNIQRT